MTCKEVQKEKTVKQVMKEPFLNDIKDYEIADLDINPKKYLTKGQIIVIKVAIRKALKKGAELQQKADVKIVKKTIRKLYDDMLENSVNSEFYKEFEKLKGKGDSVDFLIRKVVKALRGEK